MTMLNQQISQIIAAELTVQPQQILAAIQLLDDGNTIPFIARYLSTPRIIRGVVL
jgi:protein Tex